jgi:hypothetical protein
MRGIGEYGYCFAEYDYDAGTTPDHLAASSEPVRRNATLFTTRAISAKGSPREDSQLKRRTTKDAKSTKVKCQSFSRASPVSILHLDTFVVAVGLLDSKERRLPST